MPRSSTTEADPALLLARRLAALPEPAMRDLALCRHLERVDPSTCVIELDAIQRRARGGEPPFHIALATLGRVLTAQALSYDTQSQLYAAAKAHDLDTLLALFFSALPCAQQERSDDRRRPLTLGHRKSLARRSTRELFGRFISDPEPLVVRELLRNPQLTEPDVVRLAARRPISSQVLRVIFDDARWVARHAVKRALVLNPATPTEIALRLLAFLSPGELVQVVQSASLAQAVRRGAQRLLEP